MNKINEVASKVLGSIIPVQAGIHMIFVINGFRVWYGMTLALLRQPPKYVAIE